MLKPSERTRTNARRGRSDPTLPEAVFWKFLRDRRLEGLKFRRQLPLGPYIADFACPSIRLIVELDGGIHALRAESDAARDAWLTANGWTVMRFAIEAVLTHPALLFEAVRHHARLIRR
ncbi:endonuclease domain-containing protein [Brevundimonas sp. TWP2-3-4b2]|uniref:endonuclease domain-containing protein n=1 Tax=Brevundimonas sp. TWP2-3-4b2 TaxID=2804595 RepID=UPI003CFAEEB6